MKDKWNERLKLALFGIIIGLLIAGFVKDCVNPPELEEFEYYTIIEPKTWDQWKRWCNESE